MTSSHSGRAFGVTFYECFADGGKPYAGMTNAGVMMKVQSGYKLPCPTSCPNNAYAVMRQCLESEPQDRPNFEGLVRSLADVAVAPGVAASNTRGNVDNGEGVGGYGAWGGATSVPATGHDYAAAAAAAAAAPAPAAFDYAAPNAAAAAGHNRIGVGHDYAARNALSRTGAPEGDAHAATYDTSWYHGKISRLEAEQALARNSPSEV